MHRSVLLFGFIRHLCDSWHRVLRIPRFDRTVVGSSIRRGFMPHCSGQLGKIASLPGYLVEKDRDSALETVATHPGNLRHAGNQPTELTGRHRWD